MRMTAIAAALLVVGSGGSLPPTPIPPTGDPYKVNYSALLHFEGTNNSTSFIDQQGRTWTANGNAKISTAAFKFGSAAGLFDGNGDYLSCSPDSSFDFGTGDFTVEFWINLIDKDSTNGNTVVCVGSGAGYWQFIVRQNQLRLDFGTGNIMTASVTLANGSWHHVAWTRASGVDRLFYDGVKLTTSGSTAANLSYSNACYVGGNFNGGTTCTNGYIDELRITKGAALYTATFTPETASYPDGKTVALLHFDGSNNSTTFTDVTGRTWTAAGNAKLSTGNYKWATASGIFDGAGDSVSPASNLDFGFGNRDWTVEFWVNPSAVTGDVCIFDNRNGSNTGIGIYTSLNSASNKWGVSDNSAVIGGASNLTAGTWYHLAICREGNTLRLYKNGVQDATFTDTRTYASSAVPVVGTNYLASQGYNGYIDDLRITKNLCRYPGGTTFNVPTGPFPDSIGGGSGTADDLFRLNVSSTQGYSVITLGEFNLYGVSAAVTRNALSASSVDSSFPVTNCVDGSAATVYKSTAIASQWVLFQVPNGTVVDHMTMTPPSSGSLVGVPKDFKLEKYNGATWDAIISCTGQTSWANGVGRTYSVATGTYGADPAPPPPAPEPVYPYPTRAIGATEISVLLHGAIGNGVVNDLSAINATINALPSDGGTVLIPDGTYLVDVSDVKKITLKSGVRLQLSAGAKIVAKPNNLERYYIIDIPSTVHDVEITGGWIQGERSGHLGTTGEWGYGINCKGSKITIHDTKVSDCWGDGIGLWNSAASDIWLYQVTSDNNRRQALTIGPVKNFHIEGCILTNTNGTAPEAGIDIEPDSGSAYNGVIKNNTITGNAGAGILLWQHASHDIVITGNTVNNNHWGIYGDSVSNIELSSNICKFNTHEGIRVDKNNSNWTITQNHLGQNSGGADRVPDVTKTGYSTTTRDKKDLLIYASSTNINVLTNYYE